MIIERFYLPCLSQASYLLGDAASGEAILIDPRRDIDDFVAAAQRRRLRIIGVVNTHFHADFVAGHLEAAAATGAWIGYGARAEASYPIRTFVHQERLSLGALQLTFLETPGHTWESISILVEEKDGAEPSAVFTGDALFIGDVGRPDLAAAVGADPRELAHAMYRSLHEVLLALPDEVRVYPAHGAGSACGKNLSAELDSTIGEQRRINPSVQPMPEPDFVEMLLHGQPSVPRYFAHDALLNRAERPLLDSAAVPILPSEAAEGAILVDTRDPDLFATGHLASSLNISLNGRFAETAGMFLGFEERVVLVGAPERAGEAKMRLGRVGIGVVSGIVDADDAIASGLGLSRLEHIDPEDAVRSLSEGKTIFLDVRNAGEVEAGRIPSSVHIPLAELGDRYRELDGTRAVIVYCASGWRSSVAASFLLSRGHRTVKNLSGGFSAWENRGVTPSI